MADANLTKTCRACTLDKRLSDFIKKARGVLGVEPVCRACSAARRRRRYAEDAVYRKAIRDSNQRQIDKNPAAHRQAIRNWTQANLGRQKEYMKRFRRVNVEQNREHQRKYRSANKGKINALTAARAAAKRNATPIWANRFYIQEAYHLAGLRAELTGHGWHVDHIVPLRSPLVCGLHVECNLQVITAKANKLKSNLWWPDMWEPM